jgi:hypothetical protein
MSRWATALGIWWLLMIAPESNAAFLGLIPGVSTRVDAVAALGEALSHPAADTSTYPPPAGIAKVDVVYQAGDRIDRIDVHFQRPVTRAALVKRFSLPNQPDSTGSDTEGRKVEYFGGAALLGLNFVTRDVGGGVRAVTYFSAESLARVIGGTKLNSASAGQGGGMQLFAETSLDGTNLDWYPRETMQQCQDDCAGHASCAGYTWIKAGTYNPQDAAMCYRLSAVTLKNPARGHSSGIK